MNRTIRQKWIDKGTSSSFKSPCTSAVLRAFGIEKTDYRYSQTMKDVIRILRRKGFTVRSRGSRYKNKSVGSIRNKLYREVGIYLIQVEQHTLLLSYKGQTIIDTDSRIRDKRKVKGIWLVVKWEDN